MANDGYVIGIDMGTGSARAGVFDARGRQVGFGTAARKTASPPRRMGASEPP